METLVWVCHCITAVIQCPMVSKPIIYNMWCKTGRAELFNWLKSSLSFSTKDLCFSMLYKNGCLCNIKRWIHNLLQQFEWTFQIFQICSILRSMEDIIPGLVQLSWDYLLKKLFCFRKPENLIAEHISRLHCHFYFSADLRSCCINWIMFLEERDEVEFL